jgi:hypothetical protein
VDVTTTKPLRCRRHAGETRPWFRGYESDTEHDWVMVHNEFHEGDRVVWLSKRFVVVKQDWDDVFLMPDYEPLPGDVFRHGLVTSSYGLTKVVTP